MACRCAEANNSSEPPFDRRPASVTSALGVDALPAIKNAQRISCTIDLRHPRERPHPGRLRLGYSRRAQDIGPSGYLRDHLGRDIAYVASKCVLFGKLECLKPPALDSLRARYQCRYRPVRPERLLGPRLDG